METQGTEKEQAREVLETPTEELLAAWTEEDKEWWGKLPPLYQGVAARHGRKLFTTVMNCGRSSFALGVLARRCRGNNELMKAMVTLQGGMNELALGVLMSSGLTMQQFGECKADVERLGQLAMVEQGKSPAGLILPPN